MTAAKHTMMGVGAPKITPAQYTGIGELVTLNILGNYQQPELTYEGLLILHNEENRFGRGYATLPFTTPVWNKPYEVVCCIDWKDGFSTYGIFGAIGNSDGFTPFWFDTSFFLSYLNGIGWPVSWNGGSQQAAVKPAANQRVFLKLSFDGNQTYRFYTSDGSLWTNTATKTTKNTVNGGDVLQIGSNRGLDSPLNANVDLNYCYIKYADEILWAGTEGAYDRVVASIEEASN